MAGLDNKSCERMDFIMDKTYSFASYDWQEQNKRYTALVKPQHFAVAVKFIHSKEELDAIPDVHPFTQPGYSCRVIGLASFLNYPVALTRDKQAFYYCAGANGLGEKNEDWLAGVPMASDPTRWFRTLEASKAHTDEMLKTAPDGLYAFAAAALHLNAIKDPDVIVCQLVPAAVFMMLSGLIENNYHRIDLPFIGESSCCDTWNYTAKTGKPGVSFGCRGDKTQGLLPDIEMRLSMTPDDFEIALQGLERLRDSGINYPCCCSRVPPELK